MEEDVVSTNKIKTEKPKCLKHLHRDITALHLEIADVWKKI